MVESPANERSGSAAYYRDKFLKAQEIIRNLQNQTITLDEIPGFLEVAKVKPNKEATKSTRVTQVCGSMEGKKVLELTEQIKQQKQDKLQKQKNADDKRRKEKEAFFKCKDGCTCSKPDGKCSASKLKECTVCHNILHSVCSSKRHVVEMMGKSQKCFCHIVIRREELNENLCEN